jgi:hypothetical protein
VQDRTHDGRTFRMLCVVDEFTREALAIKVDRKLGSAQVIETLADLMLERGVPGECLIFCVWGLGSMLPERSKDDDDFQRTAGRVAEGLRAA